MATGTQLEKSAVLQPALPAFGGRLEALWTFGRLRWAAMSARQRRWTSGVLLALAALVGGLFWYGLRTDWRTLYDGLDPDDARQIGTILTQAQIPYDVANNGAGIRVPAPQIDKARLATAAKGGVKSGRMGFEIFDKPNWVGSEFDEQVNYQRALEGELEHTVATLSDIQSARVHLVLPHDSLFREQERPAKASVVLKLRHRSLADGEADAIRNLIASAVDGLTPDHVVLVDADGHLPLGPRTAQMLELSAEQALEDKLVSTLEPVTGPGNVRASVTLDYNPAAMDETQETYDPNQTVTLSMQRSEQSTGPQPVASGVPGAASNAPNTQALPVYPRESTPPASAKSESGTYGASKTVKHVVENPGRVRRLTAAIVVNDRLVKPAGKDGPAVWQARSPQELRELTALAQAAVGFDPARGDVLSMEDISFDGNRGTTPPPLPQKLLDVAESSPLLLKYLCLLLGLGAVLAFGVRPALRQMGKPGAARSGSGKALAAAQPDPQALRAQQPGAEPERSQNQEIFEQVTAQLKREPTQSSRLLQSWIHSE
ncbi:MAG: flagellar basal-body MS-ring/collar protein FliF [Acidobacteriota bacterium]